MADRAESEKPTAGETPDGSSSEDEDGLVNGENEETTKTFKDLVSLFEVF